VVDALAVELDIDPRTVRMATGGLLPAIVAALGRAITAPAGGGAGASARPLGGLGGLAGAI